MALSSSSLKSKIITELKAQGIVVSGQYARAEQLAEAIANAVVDEITSNAQVTVTKGDSAGAYKVE